MDDCSSGFPGRAADMAQNNCIERVAKGFLMTTRESLLAAVHESPEDDAPRRVYADWLTDHGDPRGEFIAVQCELAGLTDADPRWPELKARERDLLEAHE